MPVTTNTRKLAALLGASGAGIGTDGLMQAAGIDTDMATQTELDTVNTNLNTVAFRSAMITHSEPAFALTDTKLEEFTDNTGVGTETTGDRYYDASTPVKWYWGTFAPGDNIGGSAYCMNNEGSASNSGVEYAANANDIIAAGGYATYECWIKTTSSFDGANGLYGVTNKANWSNTGSFHWGYDDGNLTFGYAANAATQTFACGNLHDDEWHHVCLVKNGSGSNNSKMYADGVLKGTFSDGNQWGGSGMTTIIGSHEPGGSTPFRGYIDEFRFSNVARYTAAFIPPTSVFASDNNTVLLAHMEATTLPNSATGSVAGGAVVLVLGDAVRLSISQGNSTNSATGTLIGTANAASAAQTKVSGIMNYKDLYGNNTLATDFKLYFTCNGGTNWTEVVAGDFTVITPDFSSGMKMAKTAEQTCTSGTDVRYKAVWANQASGSKEFELHSIGLTY